ncbi:hypothetical protein ABH892_004482 [Paenibacillus sp. RC254]|uniref:hypothetical protein n=1 Tax=Paenibacillus TaxID=44249 RepID=UPI0011EB4B51|nr:MULTISPECIES: hypothetical protein [Paenibacillus]
MEEIKQLLTALIERADVTNAKLDGIEMRLSTLEGEVKGAKEELADVKGSVDFLVHKMGEHDRDLYVIKTKQG